jgi:hypothetical protein
LADKQQVSGKRSNGHEQASFPQEIGLKMHQNGAKTGKTEAKVTNID